MKRKIILYFMIIIFLTLSLVTVGFNFALTHFYQQSIANTFQTHAEGVSFNWSSEVDLSYERLISYSEQIIKTYQYKEGELQLLNREGELIQSSSGFFETVRLDIDPMVLEGKTIYKIENIKVTKEKILALYTPLIYRGQVVGILRYVTTLKNAESLINTLTVYAVSICIVVAFLVFLISLRLGNSIVKPLKDIIRHTQKMAQGQYKNKMEKTFPHELGELADMLNFMSDEILKTDRLKNDFISSITHELRTPLTGIKGWIETIQDSDGLTKEEFQFGLNIINSESERLIGLVEDLLDFSRYQSDRMNLIKTKVQIDQLIQEVTFQLQKKMEKKELQLIVETSPVDIIVDRDKLKQVLLNVLDNAVKFSNKEEKIHIIQTTFQNELRIEIKDNGIGITKENQKHIMESFYKIDTKSLGAGLGLAISKSIIEMHHGTIQIESEYEKGTSVIILLPIEDN